MTLVELQEILRKERTIAEVSKIAGCSIPTVHRKIEALKRAGGVLTESYRPGAKPGPVAVRLRLSREMTLWSCEHN